LQRLNTHLLSIKLEKKGSKGRTDRWANHSSGWRVIGTVHSLRHTLEDHFNSTCDQIRRYSAVSVCLISAVSVCLISAVSVCLISAVRVCLISAVSVCLICRGCTH